MLIAIIDVDQRELNGRRFPLVIEDENDKPATFESIDQIREFAHDHILNSCQWWAFDLDTGESEEV